MLSTSISTLLEINSFGPCCANRKEISYYLHCTAGRNLLKVTHLAGLASELGPR